MSFGPHEERPWALDEAHAEPIVRQAVEGGITFIDTADVYNGGESEVLTGRLLGKLLQREEFVLRYEGARPHDSRREWDGQGRQAHPRGDRRVVATPERGLRRIRTRYHRRDPNTPIDETMEALS